MSPIEVPCAAWGLKTKVFVQVALDSERAIGCLVLNKFLS